MAVPGNLRTCRGRVDRSRHRLGGCGGGRCNARLTDGTSEEGSLWAWSAFRGEVRCCPRSGLSPAAAEVSRPTVLIGGFFLPGASTGVWCSRYRLPNFPHSPAGQGRERHRLRPDLADRSQPVRLFRLIQFVHLGRDDHVWPVLELEPSLQLQVRFHPSTAGIE